MNWVESITPSPDSSFWWVLLLSGIILWVHAQYFRGNSESK
jgi:hypothetical protein